MDAERQDGNAQPGDRSEEQIRRAHRFESLGHLTAGVAHDINNILGVILGYVELARMQMGVNTEKAEGHLDKALLTLGRARTLTDRMLEFSEERQSPNLGDLNSVVSQVRDLMAETAAPGLDVEVALAEDMPATPLDSAGLRQIVMNLCLNAAHAMPQGGRIFLATSSEHVSGETCGHPPGTYACLHVRDTGPGIPADRRESIFEPYMTSSPGTHSGLGLWVVRALAERYGGSVQVAGGAEGAVFSVCLPSALDVPPVPPADPAPSEGGELADVLVVDDEPGVREVIRGFLELDGYRVLEAEDATSALRQLQSHPGAVRLVFLDYLLPDLRGSELAWKISTLSPAPRVVMVTGLADPSHMDELPPGTCVFQKPFLHRELQALLREELEFFPRPASP